MIPALCFGQTQTQNYVKTTTYKCERDETITNPSKGRANVNVTYFDGLGRPVQQIQDRQSKDSQDIITHIEYDSLGRQLREYLPYIKPSNSLAFDTSGFNHTIEFYAGIYSDTTTNPYSEKFFEASPLNRVLKQSAPGHSWLGNPVSDNDHTVKFAFCTNGENEVRRFRANTTSSSYLYDIDLVMDGYYPEEDLYKTITKDENWTSISAPDHTTEEFKDKEGRLILKRTYSSAVAHDTYYVYDKYGNLTYVIPPLADSNWSSKLDGLCYQYKYDIQNRLVAKKLPGKQWEYIIYNKLGAPVMTGPTLTPFGGTNLGWTVTKYDAFGRVAYTAWLEDENVDGEAAEDLQAAFDVTTRIYEDRSGSDENGIINVWSSKVYPDGGYRLLTINYYDDYDFPNGPDPLPGDVFGEGVIDYVKGLATGTWIKALTDENDTSGETTYLLYDRMGRVIRTTSLNYLGGYTQVDTQNNFIGQPIFTKTTHARTHTSAPYDVFEEFVYSPQDRLLTHNHAVNDKNWQRLSENEYDLLGLLITKDVGGEAGQQSLQTVDFDYNIRGWLKGINEVHDNHATTDLFRFAINYDDPVNDTGGTSTQALYNGNISEIYWRSKSDNVKRKYTFEYDGLNRLNDAVYKLPGNTIGVANSYNESIRYDKNGNITHLDRNGDVDDATYPLAIDQLVYAYQANTNKLLKVTDVTNLSSGFNDDSDGTNDTSNDYGYDDFGNMTADQNKSITGISYNHLNLPVQIIFSGGQKIIYLYDATGKKLRKEVITGTDQMVTEYCGGFQYVDGRIKFITHAEGYVNVYTHLDEVALNYVFNYTDHLGNIRVSYGLDPLDNTVKILEENNYYPFGLRHRNYNMDEMTYRKLSLENEGSPITIGVPDVLSEIAYKYKYNGKEWQDELGLNMYDYGAMLYDPAIGRRNNIDPLAEKSRRWSPYSYAMDNPVFFIDKDGMSATPPDWYIDNRSGEILGQDGGPTNNYRLVDKRDFDQVQNDNGGSTTTPAATAQLQNPDVSTPVTVNDAQIQQEAQQVTDLSRTNEHQTQIVLNKYTGEVTAKRDTPGTDGGATVNSGTSPSGATIAADGSSLLLGVIHGHNLTQKPGQVNVTGTSTADKNTAATLGITVYETDAYNTPVGGNASVGRVTSGGVQTDNVGQTKGSGQGTFNFGLDALNNLPR